jgi:flagellar biogenesis protein FliO
MCIRKIIIVAAVASLLFSSAFAADTPPTGFATPIANNTSTPGQSFVQPATHVQSEPHRLEPAAATPPLPLPAAPHDESSSSGSSGPRALGAIASVLGSLVVVLGLFFVLAWIMRRGMPNNSRVLSSDVVQVLGRAPLAGRQQMHVLRFGNKLLLVCVSPSGVDTLGEITDPLEIDRIAGLCAQTEVHSATTAFKQIFGQLSREKLRDPRSPIGARTSLRTEEAADA